jgi:hypothetical protein
MPAATGQFGTSTVVALFQGFLTSLFGFGNVVVTRASQNCSLTYLGSGQFQLNLNNVVPDDCNFLVKVGQFQAAAGQSPFGVAVAFPPVGADSGIQTYNYITFGFYTAAGAQIDPYANALFNVAVFACNDGLVGVINPATGLPFRTPGNP